MFSFSKRKQTVDAIPRIRKLIDFTCPNRPTTNASRGSRRYNRCFPVFLADWKESGGANFSNCGLGFTTDISDSGFSVLTQFCPEVHDNVVGIYLPAMKIREPWYFLVNYAGYRSEPQGHIRIGYKIVRFLNEDYSSECNKMTPFLMRHLEVEPAPSL